MPLQPALFLEENLPEGFTYQEELISKAEEQQIIAKIQTLEFSEVRMHGVAAKRRVIQLGWLYAFETRAITPGPQIPEFLLPLQQKLGEWLNLDPQHLSEVLITEYQPGAVIGWHRDGPAFDKVVGVSLGAACPFKFRRGEPGNWEVLRKIVEPRSAYLLDGPARWEWQHSIPALKTLRYSITFRTILKRSFHH